MFATTQTLLAFPIPTSVEKLCASLLPRFLHTPIFPFFVILSLALLGPLPLLLTIILFLVLLCPLPLELL